MIKKILITLCLTGIIFPQQQTDIPWPTLAQTDWPMIKHDPQFTGRSPFKGPQTPTVIWTKDMPNGIFSGPVIGENGNLYFGSYYTDLFDQDSSDYFYSYSSKGDPMWIFRSGTRVPPQSGILIDSSQTIYFGSRDSNLYALNTDGTLKWKFKASSQFVAEVIPNIDLQGNIYITALGGKLYSIKPDGTLNWANSYENGPINTSPVFSPDGNTIYLAGRDSNMFAINLDGSVKWKFSCNRIRRAVTVDSNGNIYFLPYEVPHYLYSINEAGNIRWKFFIQNSGFSDNYSIPTIDYSGNISFIAHDTIPPFYRALYQVNNNGGFRWKYVFDNFESNDFSQPLICDTLGTIYVGSTIGKDYYAISNDGTLKWRLPLTEIHQQVDNTSAISEDGTLYIGVHNTALDPNQTQTLIAIKDTGTVGVNEIDEQPTEYSLQQNYPNPFNPTTTISYQIPQSGFVQLKVYDILGEEVATLINEIKPQGFYSVNFDASSLPSGVYIYSLRVNAFVQNHKMTLLK